MRVYHAKLRAALMDHLPSRAHIIEEKFCHGISEYLLHRKLEGAKCIGRTILATDVVTLNGCRYGHNTGGEVWKEMFVPLPARNIAAL
jgi:hypothetical protein